MDVKDLETLLIQYKEEHLRLLKENNFLLREIVKQNQLMAEIMVESIWHYSYYYLWPEPTEIKRKREELKDIYEKISQKLSHNS